MVTYTKLQGCMIGLGNPNTNQFPWRIHGAAIYGNMDPINIPPSIHGFYGIETSSSGNHEINLLCFEEVEAQHEAMEIVWSSARSWHCPNMPKQHVKSFQRYKSDTSPPTVGLKHPTTTCAFTIFQNRDGDSSNLSPKRTGSPQGPSVPTTIHYASHEKYWSITMTHQQR